MRQGEVIELEIPSSPEYVSIVRRAVEGVARRMEFDVASIEDLKLAVGEACNNAVRYSCPHGDDCNVGIRCEIVSDGLVIEVRNSISEHRSLDLADCPDPTNESGRGLYMIRQLVDEVDFLWEPDIAVVKMLKRLTPRAAA